MNVPRLARTSRSYARRCLHQSSARRAVTNMQMPAMSPTMTEGGIASWKKKEGESYMAGDVLLEIETDKATIDVEAQDDGVLGKIIAQDGTKNVPVGKIIAILAEEGDDISNLEIPKEESKPSAPKKEEPAPSAPTPKPEAETQSTAPPLSPQHANVHIKHDGPLFPSVHRLLLENGISDPAKIKGTGIRGMLTKGDVLAHLGKASNPLGTYKPFKKEGKAPEKKPEPPKPLDGAEIRRLIVSNMLNDSIRARAPKPSTTPLDFDSIIADYLPTSKSATQSTPTPPASTKPTKSTSSYLDGLI